MQSAAHVWVSMRIDSHAESAAILNSSPRRALSEALARRKAKHNYWAVVFYLALAASILLLVLSFVLFGLNIWSINTANSSALIGLELVFLFSVLAYLSSKRQSTIKMFDQLGLSRKALNKRTLLFAVALFLAIIGVEIGLGIFSSITNIPLPTNVAAALAGVPVYFLVFSVVVTPVCEEVLFRGFLVPRIGIILSALVFAFLHLGYASISEFVGALIFGLLAGYVFKKTKSLYPSIAAHALVNAVGLAALFIH